MGRGRRKGRLPGLTQREQDVLDRLYELKQASAVDIQNALSDELSNATVRTVLRALLEKQRVTFVDDGGRYMYQPTVNALEAATHDFKRIADIFFNGSAPAAVANLLNANVSRISDRELDQLASLVETYRRRRSNDD